MPATTSTTMNPRISPTRSRAAPVRVGRDRIASFVQLHAFQREPELRWTFRASHLVGSERDRSIAPSSSSSASLLAAPPGIRSEQLAEDRARDSGGRVPSGRRRAGFRTRSCATSRRSPKPKKTQHGSVAVVARLLAARGGLSVTACRAFASRASCAASASPGTRPGIRTGVIASRRAMRRGERWSRSTSCEAACSHARVSARWHGT